MRTFQILDCILIFGFACSLVACDCSWNFNSNTPHLTSEYTRDFGEQAIDNLRGFEDGFVCSVDSRELLVVNHSGEDKGSYDFPYDIKSIYTEDENKIMVLLDNNEVVSLSFENGSFDVDYDIEFDDTVDAIAFWYHSYFVLMEDGDLYVFGRNSDNLIDANATSEEVIDIPARIAENVSLIAGHYAVLKDNSVLNLLDGEISECLDEEILAIYDSYNIFVVTEHILYTLSDSKFVLYADTDTPNVGFSSSNCVYVHDNHIFYSGQLSETPRGKGVSWVEKYDLGIEEMNNICAVSCGFLVWDSHGVEFYSV